MNRPTSEQKLIQPPFSRDAERAVLGALMIKPDSLALISDWIGEDDFFTREHRAIFSAITALTSKAQPCDAVTLAETMQAAGTIDEAGGFTNVIEIANETPSAANIVAYAEIVAEKSRLRAVFDLATKTAQAALKRNAEASVIIGEATQALSAVGASVDRGGLVTPRTMLKSFMLDLQLRASSQGKLIGVPTPYETLNRMTLGFQKGQLVLLAGRANMGKSVIGFGFAWHAAMHLASEDKQVLVFSLEMTKDQVIRRAVASLGHIDHNWLLDPVDGGDSEMYWTKISAVTRMIHDAPIQIDETAALTMQQIEARAKRAHLRKPVGLVVIDHMHIVRTPGRDRVSELGEVASRCKALAKDLKCPVVALAQLNRSVAGRTEKRPVMSDLRGSGEIEQDADLIIFVHREDYYDPTTHLAGVVELEIGKGRDIKTGQRIYLQNRFDQMRADPWVGAVPVAIVHEPANKPKRGGFQRPNSAAHARQAD